MTFGSKASWLILQLADSAFPTGGFAHSGGIEGAFQNGELRTRDHLLSFLEAAIPNAGRSSLPFVSAAHQQSNPFSEIDALCDAFTSNHVANRASRLQGRAFLASSERAFHHPLIAAFHEEHLNSPTHLAPTFGTIARLLEIEHAAALRLFLFMQLRGWVSSAVRLGIVGPLEAQSIQARISPLAEQTAARCAHLTLDDIAQTAPLIDLFQGTQDRLYSRLFQS